MTKQTETAEACVQLESQWEQVNSAQRQLNALLPHKNIVWTYSAQGQLEHS